LPLSRIGRTRAAPGRAIIAADGQALADRWASFDHFKEGA